MTTDPWQPAIHFPARAINRTETIVNAPPIISNRFYRLVTPAASP